MIETVEKVFRIVPVKKEEAGELLTKFIYDGVEEKYLRAVYEKQCLGLKELISHRYSWVGMEGDRIVGFGGLYEIDDKVLDAWVLMSRASYKYKKAIIRFCVKAIKSAFFQGYKRIQARIMCDLPQAVRFAEFFGFKREGVLRKGLLGRDCYMYSLIEEDIKE